MEGLLLHCGGISATRQDVDAVPVPPPTNTWRPVPYGQAIDFVHEAIKEQLNLPVSGEAYGLNNSGKQMFGVITLKTKNEETDLSIGMRQSYDKSLKLATAGGARVLVCDNLCFSGEAFTVLRKNTKNVWKDFCNLVRTQISKALDHYSDMEKDIEKLKGKSCPTRHGFEMLGVMLGEGILTAHQSSVAFREWREPSHERFQERNMYSLYNATTEGLKKGTPARIIDRHAAAHGFMMAAI